MDTVCVEPTVKIIRRIRQGQRNPDDGLPWVLDVRTFDVPETIEGMITHAALGLVAVSLRDGGGRRMREAATRAADKRGARIIWMPLTKEYLSHGSKTVS